MKGRIFGYLEDDGNGNRNLKPSHDAAQHEAWAEAILPADLGTSIDEEATNRRPLIIFGLVAGIIIAILGVRLFFLQVLDGNYNLALADGNRTRSVETRAPRGEILDRNGVVLATNQASFDVTVVPQLLPLTIPARTAEYAAVAAIVGSDEKTIKSKAEITCIGLKLSSGCLDTSIPQLVDSGVTQDQALEIDQAASSLPGFTVDTNPIRQYNDGGLLSVVLGYTGRVDPTEAAVDPSYGPTDLIGKLGLEKQYEKLLRGVNGQVKTEVDATGKPVRVLTSQSPVAGDNLVLSIDMGLEQTLAASLEGQMTASGAERASAVALDPRNGQILASVSLPTYDNNLFGHGISTSDYAKLVNNPGQPLFNKVVSGVYPSGSIIKPLGAAAALQEHIINTQTTIDDTGKITVPNKYDPSNPSVYLGWERTTGLGPVNVIQALAQSSDIFFYEVMGGFTDFTHYLGVDKLTEYYEKFGLGSPTGVDLPSEAAGRVPTPAWKLAYDNQPWYTGDTYNISVGQGDILVSPLQMVDAISAIANGGTLYQPHFVSSITDVNNKVIKTISPKVTRTNFISPDNLAIVRQGMLEAVYEDQGTACCKIRTEVPVQVAAKTGTAETVVHDAGISPELQSKPDAWFEAFAPYNNPTIAIVILLEHGGEGADFAAPVGRETLAWYFTQGAGAKNQ